MKRVLVILVVLLLALGVWLAMEGPFAAHRQPQSPLDTTQPGATPATSSQHQAPPPAGERNHPRSTGSADVPAPASTPVPQRLAISSAPMSVTAPRAVVELPPTPVGKPPPPPSLSGFWSWSEDQVERIVTGMQSQPDWPADQRQFLRRALADSSLSPVARNNIAAGLMRQEPQIPELHRDFLAMYQRADEDPVWRDYCLQFLTQSCERVGGPERDTIVAALVAAIDTEVGSLSGTAVLHLARLSENGQVTLDESFDKQVTRLAANPAQVEANRSTALAVLGQRGYAPALDEARQLISGKESPGIKRAAIGVVSLLGTRDDLPVLERLRSDADPSVALVATQASKAMSQRLAQTPAAAN